MDCCLPAKWQGKDSGGDAPGGDTRTHPEHGPCLHGMLRPGRPMVLCRGRHGRAGGCRNTKKGTAPTPCGGGGRGPARSATMAWGGPAPWWLGVPVWRGLPVWAGAYLENRILKIQGKRKKKEPRDSRDRAGTAGPWAPCHARHAGPVKRGRAQGGCLGTGGRRKTR